MRRAGRAALLAALLSAGGGVAARPDQAPDALYPPWPSEAGDDVADHGLAFTVPDADVLADFHGDPTAAKLVLYVGGNVFFAIGPLVQAFEAAHPDLRGRIFWETIPPGRLAEQLKAGGRITIGNMTFTAKADAYLAGLRQVRALVAAGALQPPIVAYATNTLTIMVPKANPARVTGLGDLGRDSLLLAMPNPAFEGIARQIETALTKAGGPALVKAVYAAKVADGSTILTQIHHRQTPLFLMQGRADAGVTWRSEALFQEAIGQPIGHVEIPAAQNARGTYAGALVSGAAHPAAAKAWLDFVASPTALALLERYGFEPCRGDEAAPADGGDP